jgi:hypothetical protein
MSAPGKHALTRRGSRVASNESRFARLAHVDQRGAQDNGRLNEMGRVTRIFASLALCVALVAQAKEERSPATTRAANPLVGRWEMQLRSPDGRPLPRDLAIFWVVDATHVTVKDKDGQEISRNPYTIDTSKEPPELVLKVAGEARIGWYRFEKQELQILLSLNTGRPPKSWKDGHVMVFRPASKE